MQSITAVPADPAPGETVNVTVRIKNQGTGPAASAFYVDFYQHLASSPAPFQVGNFSCHPASLAAGATFDCVGNVSYGAAGTFNMFAQVDTDQNIIESAEGNNVFGPQAITVAPLPDLTVTGIATTPASPAPGDSVAVQVTVQNIGPGAAGGFFIDFYKHLTAPPTTFGDFACGIGGGLAAGATTTCNGTVVYSSAGTFQMWAQVDFDQFERETNETNNILGRQAINVVKPTVTASAPDNAAVEDGLDPGTMRFSRSGSTASNLNVSYTVGGTAINGTDYVTLPGSATIPAGAAFVDVPVTPKNDLIKEVNETVIATLSASAAYNIGAPSSATVTITEGEDLIISKLLAPVGANPGQTFTATVGTKNQGSQISGAHVSRIFLSTDKILDGADTPLTDFKVPNLNPNQINTQVVSVTIPGATPFSKRFLIVKADADNTREANEDNNVKTKAITIGPDYVVSVLTTVPTSIPAGSKFEINDTTKNSGGPTAVKTLTRFYLSVDKALNVATDTLLGERGVPPLAAGELNAAMTGVIMPAGTTSGTSTSSLFLMQAATSLR